MWKFTYLDWVKSNRIWNIAKDLSILKYSVPDYINRDKDLVSLIKNLSPARMEDGGEGAFYIYLRKKK